MAARLELRPVKAFFRGNENVEVDRHIGNDPATERVATRVGTDRSRTLHASVLEQLIEQVLEFDGIENLAVPGLSERRAQVWPGGLAILAELIRALQIESMGVSAGAMREGLLHDLLGRIQHEDAREQTVRAMMARYQVDAAQAQRVADTAASLLQQCAEDWDLSRRCTRRSCDGQRDCTRLVSISHTTAISGMAPTLPRTPTCRDFRARNNASSPT